MVDSVLEIEILENKFKQEIVVRPADEMVAFTLKKNFMSAMGEAKKII